MAKYSAKTNLTRAILNDYGGDTDFTRRILASQVLHEMPMDALEQLFDFEHTTKTDPNGVEVLTIVATLKRGDGGQVAANLTPVIGARAVELVWKPETVTCADGELTNWFAETFVGTYQIVPALKEGLWSAFGAVGGLLKTGPLAVCKATAQDHWRKNIMASIEHNDVQPTADQDRFNAVKYEPVTVSHPGVLLKEKMDELGWDTFDLHMRIVCSEEYIERILIGSQPVKPAMAEALERETLIPKSVWLSAQANYDRALAKSRFEMQPRPEVAAQKPNAQ